MKKAAALFAIFLLSFINGNTMASSESGFDPILKLNGNKNYSKEIKERDYKIAKEFHKKIAGSLLGLSVDFEVGYGTTNANVDATSTQGTTKDVETNSKGGFLFGAILNLNLFDLFNFTTGLDFTKKNFGVTIPSVDSLAADSLVQDFENNYLNIPLNINFSTMVSDDVGISFSGGPYLGFLLNAENAVSGFKDFDFGLNGILTGRYYLNPFVSILLGTKGQYGGLNNLISTSSVKKMHTFNWGAFTGLSVGF